MTALNYAKTQKKFTFHILRHCNRLDNLCRRNRRWGSRNCRPHKSDWNCLLPSSKDIRMACMKWDHHSQRHRNSQPRTDRKKSLKTNQSISQSINRSIDQSIIRSINQMINVTHQWCYEGNRGILHQKDHTSSHVHDSGTARKFRCKASD